MSNPPKLIHVGRVRPPGAASKKTGLDLLKVSGEAFVTKFSG